MDNNLTTTLTQLQQELAALKELRSEMSQLRAENTELRLRMEQLIKPQTTTVATAQVTQSAPSLPRRKLLKQLGVAAAGLVAVSAAGATTTEALAENTARNAVSGIGGTDGYGGKFAIGSAGLAQLYLKPGTQTKSPTTGAHQKGELYTDSAGGLWYCVTDGTPGSWVNLSGGTKFYPFTQPDRFFDSRSYTGTTAGFTTLQVYDLYMAKTGSTNSQNVIPDNARAVSGTVTLIASSTAVENQITKIFPSNVTVTASTGAGAVATAFNGGPSKTTISPLFLPLPNGYSAANNGFNFKVWTVSPNCHVIIDLFGYYF